MLPRRPGVDQQFKLIFLPLHRVVDSHYGAEFVWPLRLGISASEGGVKFTAVCGSIDARSRAILESYGNKVITIGKGTTSDYTQHSLTNNLAFYYGLATQGILEALGKNTVIHHAFPLGFRAGFNPIVAAGIHKPAVVGPLLYHPDQKLEVHESIKQGIPVYDVPPSRQGAILERLYRRTLKNSDLILLDSHETLSQVGSVVPEVLDKEAVVLNSVGVEIRDEPRKNFAEGPSMKLLVATYLRPRKRVDTIIRALSRLPPGLFTLDIVGDGPSMPYLKRLTKELNVESTIRFKGRVDNVKLLHLLDEYDLLIHLDIVPPLVNSIVQEAVASALPVAVSTYSRVGRARGLPYGWEVDMEDEGVLADLLLELYNNPSLLAGKSYEAIQFATKEMSYKAVGRKLFKAYQGLL